MSLSYENSRVSVITLIVLSLTVFMLPHKSLAQGQQQLINDSSITVTNNTISFGNQPLSSSNSAPSNSSGNWTGSIMVPSTMTPFALSQIRTDICKASTNAEKAIGNNSHTANARLVTEKGYLVYSIGIIDANNNPHKVIVDPGNGKVLSMESSDIVNNGMSIMHRCMNTSGGSGGMNMNMDTKGMPVQ